VGKTIMHYSPTSNPLQRNKTHNPRRLSAHSDAGIVRGHRHPRSELTGSRAAVA
jgi:metallophosphoesterase superfamily enzyme